MQLILGCSSINVASIHTLSRRDGEHGPVCPASLSETQQPMPITLRAQLWPLTGQANGIPLFTE